MLFRRSVGCAWMCQLVSVFPALSQGLWGGCGVIDAQCTQHGVLGLLWVCGFQARWRQGAVCLMPAPASGLMQKYLSA